jgi:hypothetical protein
MELREALDSIATIRRRMDDAERFRGYRSVPVAASALLAIVAGWLQPVFVSRPEQSLSSYVLLLSAVAAISLAMSAFAMLLHDHVNHGTWLRPHSWLTISQFGPCLIGAAVVTSVVIHYAPEAAWILPGLWQLFYCQGVFAACRQLPRPAYAVAVFYLLSGIATLLLAQRDQAFAPWAMAIPFGVGQFLSAVILYFTLERINDPRQR